MPFLRFLSGFGKKNGRKVVLEPPDLRTNCACNRHLSLQLVASGLDPLPTYLIMSSEYGHTYLETTRGRQLAG